MSSFLQPAETAWGRIVRETPVEVVTLDDYCRDGSIERIDVLKTDTQGFELEVLSGAAQLVAERRIRLVYAELIVSNMYVGLPPFDEVYRYLVDRGFRLVAFYRFGFRGRLASWCDGVFLHNAFADGDDG
jgi:hypothetical protein